MNRASARQFRLDRLRRPDLIADRDRKQLQLGGGRAAQSSTPIQPPPLKHLVRVDPMSACHASHRRTRLQRLLHNPPPLLGTAPTTTRPSQSIQTINVNHQPIIIAHKHDVHAANTGRLPCSCSASTKTATLVISTEAQRSWRVPRIFAPARRRMRLSTIPRTLIVPYRLASKYSAHVSRPAS